MKSIYIVYRIYLEIVRFKITRLVVSLTISNCVLLLLFLILSSCNDGVDDDNDNTIIIIIESSG
jgi:hypothetical protein